MDVKWGVFRCRGSETIAHRDALDEAGLVAYAPTITIRRRVPRSNRHERKEVCLLPTFLFIEEDSIPRASEMLGNDASPMLFLGKFVLIPGEQITEMDSAIKKRMRAHELARKPLPKPRGELPEQQPCEEFKPGDRVFITSGPLRNMSAVVRELKGGMVSIDFGGFLGNVEISTFLLEKDRV